MTRAIVVGGLLLAIVAGAFVLSPLASSEPDGLEKVAGETGFLTAEQRHALEQLPTAGYELSGVDDPDLSTGLAGVVGVLATFTVTTGVALVIRRSRHAADP